MEENIYLNQNVIPDLQRSSFPGFIEKQFNTLPQEGDYLEITTINENELKGKQKSNFYRCGE